MNYGLSSDQLVTIHVKPDIPKEGRTRSRTPDEQGGSLNKPLRSYAEQAGLVMRRSPLTPYTQYALETSEYAKEYGLFDSVHRALYASRAENQYKVPSSFRSNPLRPPWLCRQCICRPARHFPASFPRPTLSRTRP